jgi:hypothetical protein
MSIQVALVSWSQEATLAELSYVAAALQKQVARDLAPVWGLSGTVDAFPSLSLVPVGYWPVIVVDPASGPATGFHLDSRGQPYAIVEHTASWSLTASHEVLEMMCDPTGWRLAGAPSPVTGQGAVGVLVEVCDPCQLAPFAYVIDGVLVSDFVTPWYYQGLSVHPSYSFTGAVRQPLGVLPGGYLAWWDPYDAHLLMLHWFDATPVLVDLGYMPAAATAPTFALREAIDGQTGQFGEGGGLGEADPRLTYARHRWTDAHAAAAARATRLEREIAARR